MEKAVAINQIKKKGKNKKFKGRKKVKETWKPIETEKQENEDIINSNKNLENKIELEKPKYLYKIQNIFYDRMQTITGLINEIKTISVLGQKYGNECLKISGVYEQLCKYLFCPTNKFEFNDDPNNLPSTAYIYIFESHSCITYPRELLDFLLQNTKLKNKIINNYKIANIKEIKICQFWPQISYAWDYQFEKGDDKFNVIIVPYKEMSDTLNLNIEINSLGQCKLSGKGKYVGYSNKIFKITSNNIIEFYSLMMLLYKTIEDVKKLFYDLNIIYENVPHIMLENEKQCFITQIAPPYYVIKLDCEHDISLMAFIGQLMPGYSDVKCPICREKMRLKLLNSDVEEKVINIVSNDSGKESVDYLLTLTNMSHLNFKKDGKYMSYSNMSNGKIERERDNSTIKRKDNTHERKYDIKNIMDDISNELMKDNNNCKIVIRRSSKLPTTSRQNRMSEIHRAGTKCRHLEDSISVDDSDDELDDYLSEECQCSNCDSKESDDEIELSEESN